MIGIKVQFEGVGAKWFYVLLNKEADRIVLHSPRDLYVILS